MRRRCRRDLSWRDAVYVPTIAGPDFPYRQQAGPGGEAAAGSVPEARFFGSNAFASCRLTHPFPGC